MGLVQVMLWGNGSLHRQLLPQLWLIWKTKMDPCLSLLVKCVEGLYKVLVVNCTVKRLFWMLTFFMSQVPRPEIIKAHSRTSCCVVVFVYLQEHSVPSTQLLPRALRMSTTQFLCSYMYRFCFLLFIEHLMTLTFCWFCEWRTFYNIGLFFISCARNFVLFWNILWYYY